MEKRRERIAGWLLWAALTLPVLLLGLFYLMRDNLEFMDRWVYDVVGPLEQFLGRIWSHFPFSVVELIAAFLIIWSIAYLAITVAGLFQKRSFPRIARRLMILTAVWLWILASFYWLWNSTYYASTFSQRSNLYPRSSSVDELAAVTEYFAKQAAQLSSDIKRDQELHWDENLETCFEFCPKLYNNIVEEFPVLDIPSVKAKPFLFSKLQSFLGFTGIYAPFTGEANINVDAPGCLIPSTIGHEMSHQRMVASEQEANFVGITACTSSDSEVFQYSGYLSGLIYLCNALYSVSPDRWFDIAGAEFTPELATDWSDNNDYWEAFSSPVGDISDKAYDSFLKHNDQELGIQSYGACVDLLVSYYLPIIPSQ